MGWDEAGRQGTRDSEGYTQAQRALLSRAVLKASTKLPEAEQAGARKIAKDVLKRAR